MGMRMVVRYDLRRVVGMGFRAHVLFLMPVKWSRGSNLPESQ